MSENTLIDKWSRFGDRAQGLQEWLKQNHPEVFTEQKHCEEGTVERIYWHYGYMIAIRDVLSVLTGG